MSFKTYSDLTKFGIVIFVLLTGLAGYALSFPFERIFEWQHLVILMGGLYFLSSGSLALNQVQEYKLDQQMPRTSKRPVASGKIKPLAAGVFAASYLLIGSTLLERISPLCCLLGWLTVILYNVVYTYWWKPRMVFGAVPGAIPGALPVTIGYAAHTNQIFNPDSIYIFFIMFLWQMPHFWILAIKYKDDYNRGHVPTLPVAVGVERTLAHMGAYLCAYAALVMAAPIFVYAGWFHILFVFPVTAKLLYEFYKFYRSHGEKGWLKFFLWINVSILVYLFVPVLDKWSFVLGGR